MLPCNFFHKQSKVSEAAPCIPAHFVNVKWPFYLRQKAAAIQNCTNKTKINQYLGKYNENEKCFKFSANLNVYLKRHIRKQMH